MPPKEIIFSPQAEKEIKALDRRDQKQVMDALRKWESGDLCPDLEKIRSQPDFFRFRVSHLRVIYYPLSVGRVVLLLIRDRKFAYKKIGDLQKRLATAMRQLKIAGR